MQAAQAGLEPPIQKAGKIPRCGMLPFRRPRTAPELWTVNVRGLDDVDLDTIPVQRVYGSRLD